MSAPVVVPATMPASSASAPDLLDVLAARVRQARDLTNLDLGRVRVVMADAFISARIADGTPAARTADALAASAPTGRSTALGDGARVDVDTAVLANSLRIHALLRDDAHPATMLHPAAVVVPVALALTEDLGLSTEQFIGAVSAGYEAMAVLGAPVAAATAGRGLRNTTLFGPAGAAVAAAVLLGLDDERMKTAVLVACGIAGGTLTALTLGSPEWRMQPGLAAIGGLAAARVARAMDSSMLAQMRMDSIEASGGLYATLADGDTASWRDAVATTGSPALHDVTHKQHATCGANQVPVAALSDVLAQAGGALDLADIAGIDVAITATSLAYPGTEDYGPFAGDGVYMSRPLALAAIALQGRGPLTREALDAALADERLSAALALISSRALDGTDTHPQAASVTLRLRDGRTLSAGLDEIDPASLTPTFDAILERVSGYLDKDAADRFAQALRDLPAGVPADLILPLLPRTEADEWPR